MSNKVLVQSPENKDSVLRGLHHFFFSLFYNWDIRLKGSYVKTTLMQQNIQLEMNKYYNTFLDDFYNSSV